MQALDLALEVKEFLGDEERDLLDEELPLSLEFVGEEGGDVGLHSVDVATEEGDLVDDVVDFLLDVHSVDLDLPHHRVHVAVVKLQLGVN